MRRIVQANLPALVNRNKRQQGKMPRALDRNGQLALNAGRAMCLPSWKNLAPLVDCETQSRNVLVIDNFVVGKDRLLASRRTATSSTGATATTTTETAGALAAIATATAATACSEPGRSFTTAIATAVGRPAGTLIVIHTSTNAPL